MKEAISKLRKQNSKISEGGSAKARDKHVARGKMLVREYVFRDTYYSPELIDAFIVASQH